MVHGAWCMAWLQRGAHPSKSIVVEGGDHEQHREGVVGVVCVGGDADLSLGVVCKRLHCPFISWGWWLGTFRSCKPVLHPHTNTLSMLTFNDGMPDTAHYKCCATFNDDIYLQTRIGQSKQFKIFARHACPLPSVPAFALCRPPTYPLLPPPRPPPHSTPSLLAAVSLGRRLSRPTDVYN